MYKYIATIEIYIFNFIGYIISIKCADNLAFYYVLHINNINVNYCGYSYPYVALDSFLLTSVS